MTRIIHTLAILITSWTTLFSQMPVGYYDTAEGLSGQQLKTALYNIIKGHIEYPYTDSSTDTWDILKESDKDTNNAENVILVYSGFSVNAAQEYNNGNGWEREHTWAKIHGDFGTNPPAGTDVHNLKPVHGSFNSVRNSRFFGNCTEEYFYNGNPTGNYKSSTQWLWMPREEVKGDVARIIFYMATRYEGENGEPDLYLIDYLPADNNTTESVFALLSDLLQWNEEDPVDAFEQNRNNVIYSYQNNRNPFIDRPEYAQQIWNPASITNMPNSEIKIYPNPCSNNIRINTEKGEIQEITITNISGTIIIHQTINTNNTTVNFTNLPSGIYFITTKTTSGTSHQKIIKQ